MAKSKQKALTVRLSEAEHKRLKLLSVEEGQSIQVVLRVVIAHLVDHPDEYKGLWS